MKNGIPMWRMCAQSRLPAEQQDSLAQSPLPLSALTEHLRHPDGETLLLLALLWLLWQEKADRALMLALAYIVI